MKTTRRELIRRTFAAAAAAKLFTLQAAEKPLPGGRMRLGSVTYNIAKDWDLPTLIKNFEATGFEGVELRTTHAHGVEVGLSKQQRSDVQKRFADSKVEIAGLGSAFEYHMPDQGRLRKEIEATKEYIVLAHDIGTTGIKVRPNGLPKEVPVEKTLEQIGKALRELGEFAEGYGQQIRLEVHGSGTSLLPNIKRIIEVADHKQVGVCWNSNQTDLEGKGLDHNFDLVKDKIFTVHLRDLYLEEYPFRRLFERLKEIHYTGFCLAEIPPSSDALRVMRYFRALFLAYQT